MKIGLILPSAYITGSPVNGVRIQARQQAKALERIGHSVTRLSPWDVTDTADFDVLHFFLGGPAMYGIECARNRARVTSMAPIIDSNQTNIAYAVAAKLGCLSSKVITVPGELSKQARSCDAVIVRSTHESQRVTHGLGVEPDKVFVALNGADTSALEPGPPTTDTDLPAEFVLHVSAYTQERKNVLRLIDAVLPTGYPLVIAGSAAPGHLLSAIEAKTRGQPQVRLFEFVDAQRLAQLYAQCKVFCLPSLHEGTGLVALEAAARGARIVITRNGGPGDYFLDMAEYVDPESTADIRSAIHRAWIAPDTDALQRHVRTVLTWENSARQLVGAWQSIMNR
jgi:glycosyltransferase involved in cell wall biosynthesis